MKRTLFVIIATLLVVCSCTLDNSTYVLDNSVGYVTFCDTGRGVTASISYPEIYDKTWTVIATKIDGGASEGAGVYEDALITDTFGAFSVGQWQFVLEGYDNGVKVLEGSVTTTIKVGSNSVPVLLHTTASDGTLSFEGSNFSMSDKGAVTKAILKIDGEDAKSWTYMQMTTTDGDLYMIPDFTKALSKGIHTLRLRYVFQSGDYEDEPVISFRIDGGATTHITTGLTEGNLTFSITLDTVEPIVND